MNRVKEQLEPEEEKSPAGDYFVVETSVGTWYVSTEMARFIEATLDETPQPRWLVFVDLTGARVRVRARTVMSIYQCTGDQRQAERAFSRALSRERKADRRWDEDEDVM